MANICSNRISITADNEELLDELIRFIGENHSYGDDYDDLKEYARVIEVDQGNFRCSFSFSTKWSPPLNQIQTFFDSHADDDGTAPYIDYEISWSEPGNDVLGALYVDANGEELGMDHVSNLFYYMYEDELDLHPDSCIDEHVEESFRIWKNINNKSKDPEDQQYVLSKALMAIFYDKKHTLLELLNVGGLDISNSDVADSLLRAAVDRQRSDIVQELLDRGASPDIEGMFGDNLIYHALANDDQISAALIGASDIIYKKIDDDYGFTPFKAAVNQRQIVSITAFLKKPEICIPDNFPSQKFWLDELAVSDGAGWKPGFTEYMDLIMTLDEYYTRDCGVGIFDMIVDGDMTGENYLRSISEGKDALIDFLDQREVDVIIEEKVRRQSDDGYSL